MSSDTEQADFEIQENTSLSDLDKKIVKLFPGLVVRKDLTTGLKQNAVVPTYVLEYLLGQHCATDDVEAMRAGLKSVKRILSKHYVHRNEAELIKSVIKEKGQHKIIDKVTAELNDKEGFYEASFTNLGLKKVPISDDFIRRYPKLLVGGIWCIVDSSYELKEDRRISPWSIDTLKPIQVANVNMDEFLSIRNEFTTDEWIDLVMQSLGFNPEMFSRRAKLLALIRLVPFCERNYNMIELGPKGTGKSHVYSEFSPHGILISGSEITSPKLFVNNSNGKVGLVGYWECICFDEFAGKDKRVDKALVDIMKNYMANRTFSRGVEPLGAEASMVFMGNTKQSVAYMLKHSHFFDQLPDKYIDSAFIDRLHAFSPGWEVSPIRSDLFTQGYGFIVDYIAEILMKQRVEDFTGAYREHFEISSEVSIRDQTGFEKTFSGLMKIIYPDGKCTKEEVEELLHFSMECRRRVREHIIRIDTTFERHDFVYKDLSSGKVTTVLTPEEIQFPQFSDPKAEKRIAEVAHPKPEETPEPQQSSASSGESEKSVLAEPELKSGEHKVYPENVKGVSYQLLFERHLKGATSITIYDPYIRLFYQIKNLIELLDVIYSITEDGEQVEVNLVTKSDMDKCVEQDEGLQKIVDTFSGSKVSFAHKYDNANSFHARSIETDTGWKITIDRGLDIFQRYDVSPLSAASRIQEERLCKSFEVTYLKQE